MKICVSCGYPKLKEIPFVIEGTYLIPSYEVCPCCGFEFGTDLLLGYLDVWVEEGANWLDESKKPQGWNLDDQLSNLDQAETKIVISKIVEFEKKQVLEWQQYKKLSKNLIDKMNTIPFLLSIYESQNDVESNYTKGYLKFIVVNAIGKCIQNNDHLTLNIIINKLADIITLKEYTLLYPTIFEWYQCLPSDYRKCFLEVCPQFEDLLTARG